MIKKFQPIFLFIRCRLRDIYSHETFTTYQNRVLDLVCDLYGSETAKSTQITHLSCGGFNRIIGINLPASIGLPGGAPNIENTCLSTRNLDLTLHVPRVDHTNVAVQVGLLRSLYRFQE